MMLPWLPAGVAADEQLLKIVAFWNPKARGVQEIQRPGLAYAEFPWP